MIIETHGGQHYEEQSKRSKFKRTLQEEQENDKLKREIALKNGIERYVAIDCRISNLEWIKNSVLNSKLNKLFDLSNINWSKCEEFALGNLVKEVCDYWKNKEDWETTSSLESIFNLNKVTIRNYLKKGNDMKWCCYSPDYEKCQNVKRAITRIKLNSNRIEIFKDDISLGIFDSASELEKQSEERFGTKLFQSNINSSLNKNSKKYKKPYKGYMFKHV